MGNNKKKIIAIISVLASSMFVLTNISHADELIQYNDNGGIIKRLQCDELVTHDSPRQSTLVCKKTPRFAVNVQFERLKRDSDYRSCKQNRDCVIIDNINDSEWRPIVLYGIPGATFGRNIRGSSCVRIQESKPRNTTWSKDVWNLCSNNPNLELAYAYAYGYKNDGVLPRFKRRNVKKLCFDDVLRRYQYRQF